ncbi:MAG: glycosyltransferase family 39 protein [Actinobacteria bacterium]|nr:glycosyltransferase family 39 protein [Actinomycetota bacterium]
MTKYRTLDLEADKKSSIDRGPSKFKLWLNSHWPDLVIIFSLTLFAAAIRIPKLMEVPLFADEIADVRAVYRMMLEKTIYLRSPVSPYTGPALHYLLKGFMKIFGVNIYMPRIFILTLGVLTVPLLYCWTRSMGNRVSGLIAGLLLSLNLPHILINSHIAWSNSMTPFFLILAITIMYFSVKNNKGPFLILGGFLLGISLQTHPSVLVIFPGILIWYLTQRGIGSRLKKPWPYLTAFAVLFGYGNMIAYNLMTNLGSWRYVHKQSYAFISKHTPSIYFTSLFAELVELSKAMSDIMTRKVFPTGLPLFLTILYISWLIAGILFIIVKKRQIMPLALLLSSLLVMPYFNKAYPGGITIHYISFLIPISFAIMGLFVAEFINIQKWIIDKRSASIVLAALITVVFIAYPAFQITTYYRNEIRDGNTNAPIIAVVRELRRARDGKEEVFVEKDIKKFSMIAGNQLLWTFESLLLLDGTRYRLISEGMIVKTALDNKEKGKRTWFILTTNDFNKASEIIPLKPIMINPGPGNNGSYGLFNFQ